MMVMIRVALLILGVTQALLGIFSGAALAKGIAGIGIAKSNDAVFAWFQDRMVASGTSRNFEAYRHPSPYTLPPRRGRKLSNIVGLAIASNDHVYAWYSNHTVSSGTSTDLDRYRAPRTFSLPKGKSTTDIIGIAIASNDRVYVWYRDGSLSSGTSTNLHQHFAHRRYRLAPGRTPNDVVGMGIAGNNHVYVWYRDGTASSGTTSDLTRFRKPYGYRPGLVLYRTWGPTLSSTSVAKKARVSIGAGRARRRRFGRTTTVRLRPERKLEKVADRYPGAVSDNMVRPAVLSRVKGMDELSASTSDQSPNWSQRFYPGIEGVDPMVAVGNQYIIVSQDHRIAFFDKQGNALTGKNGATYNMSANTFFAGFTSQTNEDGSFNSNNINLYVNFAKPCDSPDYPREACISEFYDVRVLFDPVARRFAVQAHARNQYWGAPGRSIKEYGGFCGYYRNPSKVYSNRYCDLPRRYVAFAISRTEDPRKGFHQYMLTESNFRDWPWMSVNGNTFVVAHLGRGSATSPVATVFSMQALKSGSQHPPNFRYYGKHVAGVGSVLPASHYGPTSGLTFLLGNNNQGLQIFAFQEPSNPWLRPPLRHASLKHNSLRPSRVGVVFRNGMLHALANVIVEEFKGRKRYSIRVLRIPIQKTPSGIKVSQDASRGYLDRTFGRSGPGDSPGDRVSYERPALAVNKYGDMFIGYGRYPFQVNKPLMPEVRYTLWYGNESKQRRSRLLRGGKAPRGQPVIDFLDYATAVVDPSDDTSFWLAHEYSDKDRYTTVIGKIPPR